MFSTILILAKSSFVFSISKYFSIINFTLKLRGNNDDYEPKQYTVINGVCEDKDFKPENVREKDFVIYMNTDGLEHYAPPTAINITLNMD